MALDLCPSTSRLECCSSPFAGFSALFVVHASAVQSSTAPAFARNQLQEGITGVCWLAIKTVLRYLSVIRNFVSQKVAGLGSRGS